MQLSPWPCAQLAPWPYLAGLPRGRRSVTEFRVGEVIVFAEAPEPCSYFMGVVRRIDSAMSCPLHTEILFMISATSVSLLRARRANSSGYPVACEEVVASPPISLLYVDV